MTKSEGPKNCIVVQGENGYVESRGQFITADTRCKDEEEQWRI